MYMCHVMNDLCIVTSICNQYIHVRTCMYMCMYMYAHVCAYLFSNIFSDVIFELMYYQHFRRSHVYISIIGEYL